MVVYDLGDGSAANSLTTFDAGKAQCFLPSDRQRLLAVIEAGFGDFRPFNLIVRSLLATDQAPKSVTVRAVRSLPNPLMGLRKAAPAKVAPKSRGAHSMDPSSTSTSIASSRPLSREAEMQVQDVDEMVDVVPASSRRAGPSRHVSREVT